jgi:hypothetical protein
MFAQVRAKQSWLWLDGHKVANVKVYSSKGHPREWSSPEVVSIARPLTPYGARLGQKESRVQ